MTENWRHHRARVAILTRHHPEQRDAIEYHRRQMHVERTRETVRRACEGLTARERLALLADVAAVPE